MKLTNAISLFSTSLLGFSYRYCPDWNRALSRLLDDGTLIELRYGCAVFEHETQIYEVFVGAGFFHFGHLVGFNDEAIDEDLMRRPSFRTMDRLQRMVTAEIALVAKEKEREMRGILKSLLSK
ncbi:hypothetical protein AH777_18565 [Salmonella enterica subsp. enterica serovar Give]|nr:hypothetical protein [Salmonella enterica subsp. enterica serovar Give]